MSLSRHLGSFKCVRLAGDLVMAATLRSYANVWNPKGAESRAYRATMSGSRGPAHS